MTVLVADDNEKGRELLRAYFGHLGHAVVEAANGTDAVALARRTHPDVFVLDIRMPGLDGYETARALRADPEFRDKPIFALTASAREEDKSRAMEAGFTAFLCKPISLSVLRDAITSAAALGAHA
jgi:CheY-like chemotaxis protein